VAARIGVLAAVTWRAGLELYPDADWTLEQEPELRALEDVPELAKEFEPAELKLVTSPLGSLSEKERIDASWRLEGLATLAWAAQRFELPPFDQEVDVSSLYSAVGCTGPRIRVLRHLELRKHDELQHLHKLMLTALWRVREYALRPRTIDFLAIKNVLPWLSPESLPLAGGDLAIGGMPIEGIDEHELRSVYGVIGARLIAASWLTGEESTIYSESPTDT
jgi:hypothetical protein